MAGEFTNFDEAVVVDVETTGLDPQTERIVTLSMVRARFSDLEKSSGLHGQTLDAIVNPECPIPKSASRIHGILDRDVADKAPFFEQAQMFRDFIGDLPVIAHNVSFDKRFLNAEFKRAGVKSLSRNKSFCTMRRFQDLCNGGARKGSNLDNACKILGVKGRKGGIHDASEDARMVFELTALFYTHDNGIIVPDQKPGGIRRIWDWFLN